MRRIGIPALLLLTAGCAAVGPDYAPPSAAAPAGWSTQLQDGLRPDPADPDHLARWWRILDDPVLSDLVARAIEGNLDLKQSLERVREARARRGISRAGLFPEIDASADVSRIRRSESSGSGDENDFYAAGFDAEWEIDVFGGVRRSIEAAEADLGAVEADLGDVMVSLTAEIGLNYLEARTFQTRLDVAEANIAAQQATYDLIRSRYEAGLSDELAVQQARYNLENTRSQLPVLRTGLASAKNRLAVLTGQAPGALQAVLEKRRPVPVPPATVAVGVPAESLRRRPDVRRAERELAAETFRIGEAVADLYPRFRLFGTIGLESIDAVDFLESASRFWSIGPGVTWNVFDAGAIRNNIAAQTAVAERFRFAYEAAVLTALEEVENALTAYAEEQMRRERLLDAVDAAQQAADLAQDQYAAGLVDFSSVLDAQRSLLSFQDELARSDGSVTSNLIRLYKALGGGWTGKFNVDKKRG
ncbi:efflux transporter outer membrane subunit [Desulfococcus sp.]|uniref:efflux transporter outer membrane subunit n=1 Tax=Desulfococcus sp. TaxID=2025834 RepID=UPI0035939CCE